MLSQRTQMHIKSYNTAIRRLLWLFLYSFELEISVVWICTCALLFVSGKGRAASFFYVFSLQVQLWFLPVAWKISIWI